MSLHETAPLGIERHHPRHAALGDDGHFTPKSNGREADTAKAFGGLSGRFDFGGHRIPGVRPCGPKCSKTARFEPQVERDGDCEMRAVFKSIKQRKPNG
jgi:hypothetical protein